MQKTNTLAKKMLLYIAIGGILMLTLLGLFSIRFNLSEDIVRNSVATYIVTLTSVGILSQLSQTYTPFTLVPMRIVESSYRAGFLSIVLATGMLYLLIWITANDSLNSFCRKMLASLIVINFAIYGTLFALQKRGNNSEQPKDHY